MTLLRDSRVFWSDFPSLMNRPSQVTRSRMTDGGTSLVVVPDVAAGQDHWTSLKKPDERCRPSQHPHWLIKLGSVSRLALTSGVLEARRRLVQRL